MNGTIKCISAFVIGAGIGSIVTWKFVKKKYEQIADDEIAEMREYYKGGSEYSESKDQDEPVENEKMPVSKADLEQTTTDEEKIQYSDIVKKQGYADNETTEKGGDSQLKKDKPYVIPPEDFGEVEEYDTESLTYYEDGVLADNNDEIIDNVDELIGEESLTHFGEYEDDSVFVRNDALKCDYEILRDLRRYSDAKYPRHMED